MPQAKCKRNIVIRDVAGLTMLAVSALVPVWVARTVLGIIIGRLTRGR